MNTLALTSLIITTLLILILFIFISKSKTKSQIKYAFLATILCLLICCTGLILQIVICRDRKSTRLNSSHTS